MIMRKSYASIIMLLLLVLFLWAGYYIYTENYPKEYENGTFVEIPEERFEEEEQTA